MPDALIDCTRGSRKSHTSLGSRNGAMKPPDAASTCTGMSRPVSRLELVERSTDLGDRLVGTVEGGPENPDDTDRVLVADAHGSVAP